MKINRPVVTEYAMARGVVPCRGADQSESRALRQDSGRSYL